MNQGLEPPKFLNDRQKIPECNLTIYDNNDSIFNPIFLFNVRRPSDFETAVKDKEAAKENIKVSY